MKVVVGLGNPGRRYAGTRHNVGFEVLERLAKSASAGRCQERFQSLTVDWNGAGEKTLLVQPQTFMNLSGQSVRQVVEFYQVPLDHLLVVCDDFNLPLGKLRIRPRGTHGGHNGLRDIQNHLGTTEYPRLRIGVGAAPEGEAIDFVLGRFRAGEKAAIDEALDRAMQAVSCWMREGIQETMNQYNG